MRVIYAPEGGERRTWNYEPQRMLSSEVEAIERVTGWTWQEFGEKFMAGSVMAQHALLWALMRRDNRRLKYSDVTFAMDEFQIDFDDDEISAMREALERDDIDMDDETREAMTAFIEAQSKTTDDEPRDDDADPTSPAE